MVHIKIFANPEILTVSPDLSEIFLAICVAENALTNLRLEVGDFILEEN